MEVGRDGIAADGESAALSWELGAGDGKPKKSVTIGCFQVLVESPCELQSWLATCPGNVQIVPPKATSRKQLHFLGMALNNPYSSSR